MRSVWLLGSAALALFTALAIHLAPLDPGALQLQLAFSPRAFGAVVHAWSPQDLARYRAHIPWDFLLLVCYGAFGLLLTRRSRLFVPYAPAARMAVASLTPAAALCDAVENGLHLWLTAAPRFGVAPAYLLSALAATAKWALLAAFALAVLHALAGRGAAPPSRRD